ncbi:MAG: sulfurtransferase complex subunit TusD [Pseudomonadales bacterium]|nr:sulfurtransferase complex subunit TusD [Pseudomonadales bacterium]
MKFAIAVFGAPYSSQASLSALHFAQAVTLAKHELYRVFFYHDGVLNGNNLMVPPQDELNLQNAWVEFAATSKSELVVCIASALRRGMLNAEETRRYEKTASSLDPAFIISGLGQLIDAGLQADRLVTFN